MSANQTERIRLTQYSHGAGCGCKIAPSVLQQILEQTRTGQQYPGLLVGNDTGDDAAVFQMNDGRCLISTTDFFMPVVDDAFTFGRIAACNALSDVYAMGATPFLALAILGFPVEKLPVEIARQILAGGKSVCDEAGIPLAGGHSIDSTEPIFGLAVNGIVEKEHLRRNNTACDGDLLFITKPIGTGILTTALKRGIIGEEELLPAVESMTTLNKAGSVFALKEYVHALTDVTGFGLLGHLLEMCEGSGLNAVLHYGSLLFLPGALELAKKFVAPDNTFRNWKSYEPDVSGISGESLVTLCDPQTNGGLLVAVDPDFADEFTGLLDGLVPGAWSQIGRFSVEGSSRISVVA